MILSKPWNALYYFIIASFILSASILGTVFIMQYGFHIMPCRICLWERIPWGGLLISSLISLFILHRPTSNITLLKGVIILLTVPLLASCILAFYHVGVQNFWWQPITECNSQVHANSLNALRESLLHDHPVYCEDTSLTWFGLTLSWYNFLISILMLIILIVSWCYKRNAIKS